MAHFRPFDSRLCHFPSGYALLVCLKSAENDFPRVANAIAPPGAGDSSFGQCRPQVGMYIDPEDSLRRLLFLWWSVGFDLPPGWIILVNGDESLEKSTGAIHQNHRTDLFGGRELNAIAPFSSPTLTKSPFIVDVHHFGVDII